MKKFIIVVVCILFSGIALPSEKPLQSMKVGKYPQRWATKYTTKDGLVGENVRAIADCGGGISLGTNAGISAFDGEKWENFTKETAKEQGLNMPNDDITLISCDLFGVIVGTTTGVAVASLFGEGADFFPTGSPVLSIGQIGETSLVGLENGLLTANVEAGKSPDFKPYTLLNGKPIRSIVVDDENAAWIASSDGLYRYDGINLKHFTSGSAGGPVDNDIRSLYLDENGILWIGTAKGLTRYDRKNDWQHITGKNGGLPYEDVLVVTGSNGILWVGTTVGAARWDGKEWHYFQGGRYLPDDRVQAIALTADGAAWLGTPKGASKIEYKMMTLEEKADYILKNLRARHVRYGQVADSRFTRPGDPSSNVLSSSDNDGLWTSMYIAAECYRYAVTGSEEAKRFARQSLEAMMRLQDITGIPGFIARSFAKADEDVGQGGEWNHFTADGQWKWKGDTSSDEVVGHFYGYSVYYDVCATEKEKEEIRPYVHRLMSYIVDNDYYLIDTDGKPTRWGRWNPNFFRRDGRWQRDLNSLEILSHLKTAYHITGDEKFQNEYLKLIREHHYAKHTITQKIKMTTLINHSDDELAYLAYYSLLKNEKDPEIRDYYIKSIRRSQKIEHLERNPLWNFIYGATVATDDLFDLEGSAWTLQHIHPDMIEWGSRNSHRADIEFRLIIGRHLVGALNQASVNVKDIEELLAKGRFGEIESVVPLPADERGMKRWNGNPYALDSGGGGWGEDDGAFYLLPYWMGRYYKFITEEE
ncbi:MAG: two-component regulator propeller domain-containing protein [bacterium]